MIYAAIALIAVIVLLPALVVHFAAIHQGPLRPMVALTIDDGPDPHTTPALLDALDAHDIRATFFCIARKLEEHPALAEAIVARGHELANHTYSHSPWIAFWPTALSVRDLRRADALVHSRYFRAVAGVLSPPLYRAAKRLGLTPIHWTATARDGALQVSVATAMKRLHKGFTPGGILVIHDRPGRADWVAAIKKDANARELRLVTLSKLLDA